MGNTSSINTKNTTYGYGCIPEHYDHNDKRLYIPKDKIKQINCLEVDISKLYPPVKNQKSLNISTAIHVADTIVYEQKNLNKIVTPDYLFIYYLYNLDNKGGSIRDTFIQVNKYGIIKENKYPVNHFDRVLKQEYKNLHFRNEFTFKKVPRNLDYFKACLVVLKKGIIFGFSVYESFFQVMKWDNDGMMPTPKVPEKRLGIQTGICVGYSEQKKAFLIRNSWGSRWKKNGYFFMPFEYMMSKNCNYFWVFYFRGNSSNSSSNSSSSNEERRKKRTVSNTKRTVITNADTKRFMPSFPPLKRKSKSLSFSDTDDDDNKKKKSTKRKKAKVKKEDIKVIGMD